MRRYRDKNREGYNAYMRDWRKKNPDNAADIAHRCYAGRKEQVRGGNLEARYGITLTQRDALFEAQGAVCAVCSADSTGTERDWHVDHDHASGIVRGILCHHCNTMLGLARDNPAILSAAISYLRKFENGGQEQEEACRR